MRYLIIISLSTLVKPNLTRFFPSDVTKSLFFLRFYLTFYWFGIFFYLNRFFFSDDFFFKLLLPPICRFVRRLCWGINKFTAITLTFKRKFFSNRVLKHVFDIFSFLCHYLLFVKKKKWKMDGWFCGIMSKSPSKMSFYI